MYQKRNKEISIISLFLGDYSKKYYLREISKKTGMPLKTTQAALLKLEKMRILKPEISGKNKYFYLNLDNIETKSLILQAEILRTADFIKKYPVFNSFLKEIKHLSEPIIIFGSFARLDADRTSDVDIIVVSDGKVELPSHALPNRLHRIEFSEKDFVRAFVAGETMIEKVRESHVIINNHSFFVNLMWNKYAR
jgi:predicted nucleotidyltransferase